jgi:glycosyltransferase involved in cell wall biosynthesis
MEPGGAERQVAYLAKGLVDEGAEVHVALLGREGANYQRLLASGATIHIVELYPKRFRFLVPLLRLLREVRPDITYLWQRPFDVLGGIACFISGAACVHAERTDPAKLQRGLKFRLRRWIVPLSAGVVANSEAGRRYWEGSGRLRGRVITIPNIIPAEELAAVVPSQETAGSAVVIGRLDAGKNVLALIKAIAGVRDEGITIPLWIVGDGPLYDAVESLVAECGLKDQVELAGYRPDVWSLMKGGRLFIALSHYEGEPNAVLEAVAMRRNLLLSDIPPHRLIAASARATYVSPDSVEAIAAALKAAFKDSGDDGIADDTLDSFVQNRSAPMISQKHLLFFESVIGAGH